MWKSFSNSKRSYSSPLPIVLGRVLFVVGGSAVICGFLGLSFGESIALVFLGSGLLGLLIATPLVRLHLQLPRMTPRQGILAAVAGWGLAAVFGAIPFWGAGLGITDGLFESMSGFTTTGATILRNPENWPATLILWRAITQWLGGAAVLLFVVNLLPLLDKTPSMHYAADTPGPGPSHLVLRLNPITRSLIAIYFWFTVLAFGVLLFADLSLLNTVCLALSTVSTGGFMPTTKLPAGNYLHISLIFLMLIAGTNFSLHHFALKGQPIRYWRHQEWRFWLALIVVGAAGVAFSEASAARKNLVDVLFPVVSAATTTGFPLKTPDHAFARIILFWLMIIGATGGSTGGGLKAGRLLILLKLLGTELRRMLHPTAYLPIKLRKLQVEERTLHNILFFVALYLLIFLGLSLTLSWGGWNLTQAAALSASALSNIGPPLSALSPDFSYAWLPIWQKWLLLVAMLMGRLEILSVVVLLKKSFWQ